MHHQQGTPRAREVDRLRSEVLPHACSRRTLVGYETVLGADVLLNSATHESHYDVVRGFVDLVVLFVRGD